MHLGELPLVVGDEECFGGIPGGRVTDGGRVLLAEVCGVGDGGRLVGRLGRCRRRGLVEGAGDPVEESPDLAGFQRHQQPVVAEGTDPADDLPCMAVLFHGSGVVFQLAALRDTGLPHERRDDLQSRLWSGPVPFPDPLARGGDDAFVPAVFFSGAELVEFVVHLVELVAGEVVESDAVGHRGPLGRLV